MRPLKTKQQYKRELNILIKEYSKIDARVNKMKIDINRYCNDLRYRHNINYRIKNYERINELVKCFNKTEKWKATRKKWIENNLEKYKEAVKKGWIKYIKNHPEYRRKCFEKWTINNPRKAMLCASASRIATAIISRLWIRPTVCPHCGRSNCNIDFHHPNHLFWWKWTFCCKSCHYYFNRDKVPASDTIIDLKKLLRESNSH